MLVGEDVRGGGDNIHGVLGPVPHVLPLQLSLASHHPPPQHLPHLPRLLLARHGKHLRQPHHLLLVTKIHHAQTKVRANIWALQNSIASFSALLN